MWMEKQCRFNEIFIDLYMYGMYELNLRSVKQHKNIFSMNGEFKNIILCSIQFS